MSPFSKPVTSLLCNCVCKYVCLNCNNSMLLLSVGFYVGHSILVLVPIVATTVVDPNRFSDNVAPLTPFVVFPNFS